MDQAPQDELVWEYFGRRRDGFFVEVGANDPKGGSQTWLLEENGWRGILVEPQSALYGRLCAERRHSRVFQAACSSADKEGEALLHIPSGMDGFSTLEKNVDDLGVVYEHSEKVKVMTLDRILGEAGNPKVDFLSIDVEGTELDVLKGLDFTRRPALILIEDKCNSLQKHRYLTEHGYKLVKRTELNNWYVPKDHPFTMTTVSERLKLFRKMFLGLPIRKLRHFRRRLGK